MAKMTFNRDPERSKRNTTRPIPETKMEEPTNTFNLDSIGTGTETSNMVYVDAQTMSPTPQVVEKRPVGRPKTGRKEYQTVRLTKATARELNALKQALYYKTQEDMIVKAMDMIRSTLTDDQKQLYKIWLDTYNKQRHSN